MPPTESQSDSTSPSKQQRPPSIASRPRHAPSIPSQLRESHTPQSPEDARMISSSFGSSRTELEDGDGTSIKSGNDYASGDGGIERGLAPTVRTRLLDQSYWGSGGGSGSGSGPNANQTSDEANSRPHLLRHYGSIDSGSAYGGTFHDEAGSRSSGTISPHNVLGDAVTDGLLGGGLGLGSRTSTTQWLAERHGVKNRRAMYIQYYLPVTNWIRQYRWKYVRGDLIAALTMASFYIPMSLSYASNLAHLPPINGLYAFVFNPFVYALLGTCPQMVVGPEAAGSLLTGQVVRENINSGKHADTDFTKSTQIAGMVTGISGAIILLAGLCRLGFLDSVLSRPFLRGFISAIGIVILVDQLIPEMGLTKIADHAGGAAHGSSLDKLRFLFENVGDAHKLTCAVSFGTFAVVMLFRELKRRLQPRFPGVAYFPDRFLVVVFSAVLAWRYKWDQQGLSVLGDIRAPGKPFKAHFPFTPSMLEHATDAFSTAFLIALLGFFESSVASKGLSTATKTVDKIDEDGNEIEETDGIKNMTVSANRELVALGVANIIGGMFMALPAFGGYGRSKVNASTGGKTPMSSVFLSLITVFCTVFLLPYFYYIPKGVLSAMISVVAYSLIEEAPHDVHFFYKISGWSELTLMLLIFLTTFFWNLRIGIAVGIGLSLLRLMRHATRPRIQILGRVPGTRNEFENAEHGGLEIIPYCLIVKIPEPLTFANTGSLKDRLTRLEHHGTATAHPALPRVRGKEHNRNVVFDIHGVTGMDPAAAQVFLEIVQGYRDRGTRVFFCRLHSKRGEVWRLLKVSGLVDAAGGEDHFVRGIEEALRRADTEDRGVGVGVGPGAATTAAASASANVTARSPSPQQELGGPLKRTASPEDMGVAESRVGG